MLSMQVSPSNMPADTCTRPILITPTLVRHSLIASRHKPRAFVVCAASNGKDKQQDSRKEQTSSKPDVMNFSLAPEGSIEDALNAATGTTVAALASQDDLTVTPPTPPSKPPTLVRQGSSGRGKLDAAANRPTGLRRTPLGGGVKNATLRYDLPPPAVAVRNLVERAHFAHLCTVMSNMHHRRAGYPFGTLVDFACDGAGFPILCLSPLGIHTRNLQEDPRASIVVQMPGWTGLANARVTIFGDVYPVPSEMHELAREVFSEKHASDKREKWVTGNFHFFRMHRITDIYFVGGFGTLQWVNVDDYINAEPDLIVLDNPDRTIQMMNERFSDDLRVLLSPGAPLQDAHIISVDRLGADVRVRKGLEYSVQRVGFREPVSTRSEALKEMEFLCS